MSRLRRKPCPPYSQQDNWCLSWGSLQRKWGQCDLHFRHLSFGIFLRNANKNTPQTRIILFSDTTQMSSEIRPHRDIDISCPQALFESAQPSPLESTHQLTNHLESNSQSPAESHMVLSNSNSQNLTKTKISNSHNNSSNISYNFISLGDQAEPGSHAWQRLEDTAQAETQSKESNSDTGYSPDGDTDTTTETCPFFNEGSGAVTAEELSRDRMPRSGTSGRVLSPGSKDKQRRTGNTMRRKDHPHEVRSRRERTDFFCFLYFLAFCSLLCFLIFIFLLSALWFLFLFFLYAFHLPHR